MKVLLSSLMTGILSLSLLSAQEPEEDLPKPLITSRVDVVNVLATVRKGDREYVANLSRHDFTVYEDGVPQEIEFFSYQAGEDAQPLTVVLAMDTSGSVKDKLEFERMAAMEFFNGTLRPNTDLAALVQFDSEINLVQDFTFDLPVLEKALGSVRAGGHTKLYDAIYLSVDEMLRHQFGRRVLVVLSDGRDTASSYSREEAIRKAQEEDVVIFGIGVEGPQSNPDFGALEDMSKATGGDFFKSKVQLARLRDAFSRINAEIKNQYSIGYVSSNTRNDGKFREIEVKVRRGGVKVKHREGYYAPSAFADSGSQ
ncbi:MAG TPA: VWA domain-containing protein [Acidobacteriota bacterium]|nr:VWA domain-containing protein [Acidobacteriota bacterium]